MLGRWGWLHKYYLGDKNKEGEMGGGHAVSIGDDEKYSILVVKSEGKT
jgi:hypothetical protein